MSSIDPTVEVKLGGKTYKLLFSLKYLDKAEDLLGRGILIWMLEIEQRTSFKIREIAIVLWAGLQANHAEEFKTVDDVIDRFHMKDIGEIINAVITGMRGDNGEQQEKQAGNIEGEADPTQPTVTESRG